MTTKEMIEVLQAFDRGEEIEQRTYQLSDNPDREWWDMVSPKWDFDTYDYRIKSQEKKRKFKVGDEIVCIDRSLDTSKKDILKVEFVEKDKYHTDKGFIRLECENLWIKIDDCLWYWEWYDENDECYKNNINDTRYTKSGITKELEGLKYNITTKHQPVYVLGFKLPEDTK